MQKKGQIEFAAILGVIIVVVITVYYMYSTSVNFPETLPQSVSEEQKLVGNTVANVGREGADIAIKLLEQQGGFIVPNFDDTVSFTRVAVAYWQKCGNSSMTPTLAEITKRLEAAVKSHINHTLYGKREYFGKNISIDLKNMSVSANILSDKIDFMVYLPTTVQGYAIRDPYKFSVQTKFGRIYEFGKNYAEEAAKNRYLELFLLSSMYFSKYAYEGGEMHPELPTTGVFVKCGENIFRSPQQISSALEGIVEYTLANVMWWRPISTDVTKPKLYGIEKLKGKTYPELNPLFHLPDDFDIPINSGIHMSNPKPLAKSKVITTSGLCMSTYQIRYSFALPAIIRVRDDSTGNYFNFATLVDVKDMMPGNCELPQQPNICLNTPNETGGKTECTTDYTQVSSMMGCTDAKCPVKIRAVRQDGSPVENASVMFGGCLLEKTDSNGETEGFVTCNESDLYVYHDIPGSSEQQLYARCNLGPSEAGGTYTLHDKYANVTIDLYQVMLHRSYLSVTRGEKESVTHRVLLTFKSNGCEKYIDNTIIDDNVIRSCSSGDDKLCLAAARAAEIGSTVSVELQPGAYEIEASMMEGERIIASHETSHIIGTRDERFGLTIEYWG